LVVKIDFFNKIDNVIDNVKSGVKGRVCDRWQSFSNNLDDWRTLIMIKV